MTEGSQHSSHPLLRQCKVVNNDYLLSKEKCKSCIDKIMLMPDMWLQRAPFDFYTLGAASYLDGPCSANSYIQNRTRYNHLLQSTFQDIYTLILDYFEDILGPCCFHPKLGLPGFHIFSVKPGQSLLPATILFAQKGGSIHLDIQYKHHDSLWTDFTEVTWDQPLSFTLALAIPSVGAGMNVWPSANSIEECIEADAERIRYKQGGLVWFIGPLYHQIAPIFQSSPSDQRITLQGHGLFCDGKWVLYF